MFRATLAQTAPDNLLIAGDIGQPSTGYAAAPKFSIKAVSDSLDGALQDKIDNKTKPLGSLGLLEKIAFKVGRIQNTLSPIFTNPHMLIFAGDHGAAKAGISAYPQDVSWQMVENYLQGGAGANVFSRLNGLKMVVVDAGVAHDFGEREGLINAKISPTGTRNYLVEPAMTRAQCELALAHGADFARDAIAQGCNILGLGEKGIGNTGSASLITHLLTGAPLVECVGRGTGIDDAGLAHKRALMQQAIDRANLPANADVMTVLTEFGGFEIVMMTGAYLAAAEAGITIMADGVIATSALLAAARIEPNVLDYVIFCHKSAEAGHIVQLKALNADPILDIGMRLGEGTGAMVAYPLLCAAMAFMNEMASFESAGVSKKIR
ncbi:nicotinate-nucleotide--dimethylbenzimidazole phosphoribosyltransferase [Propionivibrio limicola]|uniref:nicotinate-nucleotide--dimethylbenzimidazole phosphoribosyltransferase n=1 Tax=Propionivibrio limicola TaxID=167645 RepID=UPI00129197C4|nr:nicotinate-nucleotide--dimethylbenzimidazole phosphoribosyltransferase [Propionivibrio limicola]